jgi:WD40 repeat protein
VARMVTIGTAVADACDRAKVFISYSRTDLAVAEQLVSDLDAQDFDAYLDKHDILPGEPWQERLSKLIESADTVVFLLSPDSITSKTCDWEVNEAERLSKRVLPVVVRDVSDTEVPGRLKRLNYVFLRQCDDRAKEHAKLASALLTNIDWIRDHTRFGELAGRWAVRVKDSVGRAEALFLRGPELAEAELWISHRPREAPEPTDEQRAFISASRKAELANARRARRRNQIVTTGSLVAALVMAVLSWYFFGAWRESQRAQSLFLAELAQQQAKEGDPLTGVLLALEGLRDTASADLAQRIRPLVFETHDALEKSLLTQTADFSRVGHDAAIASAKFSPDESRVLTISASSTDGTARLWDAGSGKASWILGSGTHKIYSAVFSPNGRLVLTTSFEDGTARLWDAETGRPRMTLLGHTAGLDFGAFSPDGTRILTASRDTRVLIWQVTTGQLKTSFPGHNNQINSVMFSSDGSRVLTASEDKTARLWGADSGHELATFDHTFGVQSAALSPDEARVVTASGNAARIFETSTRRLLATLSGHGGQIRSVVFSPDGTRVLTASNDSTARLWSTDTGDMHAVLADHGDIVWTAVFSHDGTRIVTASADDKRVLTASADATARLWDTETGTVIATYGVASSWKDGTKIYSDDRLNKSVRRFSTSQESVNHAKSIVPRCLTAPQRNHFHLSAEPPRWCKDLKKWPYDGPANTLAPTQPWYEKALLNLGGWIGAKLVDVAHHW